MREVSSSRAEVSSSDCSAELFPARLVYAEVFSEFSSAEEVCSAEVSLARSAPARCVQRGQVCSQGLLLSSRPCSGHLDRP